jgi:NAD+ synthase (glutamine-hydrolysing)
MNTTLGEFDRTVARMVAQTHVAAKRGVELVVYPMTVLTSSDPVDLVNNRQFELDVARALNQLAQQAACACLVPFMTAVGEMYFLEFALVSEGSVVSLRSLEAKTYGLGMFTPGGMKPATFGLGGLDFGLCWNSETLEEFTNGHAVVDVVLFFEHERFAQGDPASHGVYGLAANHMQEAARAANACIIDVNPVYGLDRDVMIGASYVLAPWGDLMAAAPAFEEAFMVFDLASLRDPQPAEALPIPAFDPTMALWHTLKLALRDFAEKNHYAGVVVPVTGNVTSSTLLLLAVEALGPLRVRALVAAPDAAAQHDARRLADSLHVAVTVLAPAEVAAAAAALGVIGDGAVGAGGGGAAGGDNALAVPGEIVPPAADEGVVHFGGSAAVNFRGLAVRARLTQLARSLGYLALSAVDKTGFVTGQDPDAYALADYAPFIEVLRTDILTLLSQYVYGAGDVALTVLGRLEVPHLAGLDAASGNAKEQLTALDMLILKESRSEATGPELAKGGIPPELIDDFLGRYHASMGRPGAVPCGPFMSGYGLMYYQPRSCAWRERAAGVPAFEDCGYMPGDYGKVMEEFFEHPHLALEVEGEDAQQDIERLLHEMFANGALRGDKGDLWQNGMFSQN